MIEEEVGERGKKRGTNFCPRENGKIGKEEEEWKKISSTKKTFEICKRAELIRTQF